MVVRELSEETCEGVLGLRRPESSFVTAHVSESSSVRGWEAQPAARFGCAPPAASSEQAEQHRAERKNVGAAVYIGGRFDLLG